MKLKHILLTAPLGFLIQDLSAATERCTYAIKCREILYFGRCEPRLYFYEKAEGRGMKESFSKKLPENWSYCPKSYKELQGSFPGQDKYYSMKKALGYIAHKHSRDLNLSCSGRELPPYEYVKGEKCQMSVESSLIDATQEAEKVYREEREEREEREWSRDYGHFQHIETAEEEHKFRGGDDFEHLRKPHHRHTHERRREREAYAPKNPKVTLDYRDLRDAGWWPRSVKDELD